MQLLFTVYGQYMDKSVKIYQNVDLPYKNVFENVDTFHF